MQNIIKALTLFALRAVWHLRNVPGLRGVCMDILLRAAMKEFAKSRDSLPEADPTRSRVFDKHRRDKKSKDTVKNRSAAKRAKKSRKRNRPKK